MHQTFYAVEVLLLKLEADVDAHGVPIRGLLPRRETLCSHETGSYTEADAVAAYTRCETALKQDGARHRAEAVGLESTK